MSFRDLEAGDVFVLRWWLDTGPTPRHYLVVRKEGSRLFILRLEEDSSRLSEVDSATYDDCMLTREVELIHVYKAVLPNPVIG